MLSKDYLMLRSALRARLEARTALLQWRNRSATSGLSSTTAMLALRADSPKGKLTLMMLPRPLPSA